MEEVAVNVENITIKFNLAKEKVETLKEYFLRLVKRKL